MFLTLDVCLAKLFKYMKTAINLNGQNWMLGAAEKIARHTIEVGEQFLSTQQRRQVAQ